MTSMMTDNVVQDIFLNTDNQLALVMSTVILLLVLLISREFLMAYNSADSRMRARIYVIPVAALLFTFALNVTLFFYRIVQVGGI